MTNVETITIRELMSREIDADIGNEVLDIDIHAFCGPMEITETGEKKWHDVLNEEVQLEHSGRWGDWIYLKTDKANTVKKCANFFAAAAGYCSEKEYEKWFNE